MAPNGEAQEDIARDALAGIDPSTIQYIEAHATSTPLGDPTEVHAMSNVYGASRSKESPCVIGSIKPNVGHLEAGAGVMGFIKAVMAIDKGIIPPQANLETPNKKVDWNETGLKLAIKSTPWPDAVIRRAAICSYGYGGTVSHVVIEAAPTYETPSTGYEDIEDIEDKNVPMALLFSGTQESRIKETAQAPGAYICGEAVQPLSSIACTLATRREHHSFRTAVVAESLDGASDSVNLFRDNKKSVDIISCRTVEPHCANGAVWVFSDFGSQWQGMGKELVAKEIVFQDAIAELDVVYFLN